MVYLELEFKASQLALLGRLLPRVDNLYPTLKLWEIEQSLSTQYFEQVYSDHAQSETLVKEILQQFENCSKSYRFETHI